MIKIIEKVLSYDGTQIKKSDSIIELTADVDCSYIGVFNFNDGSNKVITFDKIENVYQGRMIIRPEEIPLLKTAMFHIVMIDGPLNESSNVIKINFAIEQIKKDIKKSLSNDIETIYTEIAKINKIISSLKDGKVLDNVNIVNKEYIKKGMIPVAVDDKGNFIACFPFANNINCVNGQRAVNGVVNIDASMIKYIREMSIAEAIKNNSEALLKQNDLLNTVIEAQKDMMKHINELDIKLETHINNGII